MIHQSLGSNDMCYRRFNKSLNNREYLAYANYATEWISRADFYCQSLMGNTQFYICALHLNIFFIMYLFTYI